MSGAPANDDQLRLEELFAHAVELPAAEQAGYVERECGDNAPLRVELLRLLAAHAGEDHLRRLGTGAEPGTRIGAFELREKLGEGGMGTVYAAEQRGPVERRVALKLIKPGMDSAQVLMRFEAERQALARMAHPNVAQVYDGGTTPDGRPFFAMELVDGEPVTSYCDRHTLTTRARLGLFLQICHGVQHAHVKGLIHRDLKPSNLIVTQQDGQAVPKIIDFGIARATTGRLTDRSLHTQVGQIVGTLDYMSPEQADPTGADIDIRSDVYTLGVVLYQLLSGQLPFHHLGDNVPLSERQRAIREVDPPTPSTRLRARAAQIAPLHGTEPRTLVRQLAGDLDWICMRALEKDPARRYQSAAELAYDVRRHLAHEPVHAGRPGALYRARKFVRRHRVGVAAAVLVTMAFVAGAYGLVAGRLEARAQQPYVDLDRLRVLQRQADVDLWPLPLRDLAALRQWIRDLERWQAEAAALVRILPQRRAERQAMGASATPWSEQDQARHAALGDLVDGLETLGDAQKGLHGSAISREHGWSIRRRLDRARELEAGFAEGGMYANAWKEKLPEIHAAYPGLNLTMQVGLLPLGPDPVSHLWEFAELLSGAPAGRDANGRVAMAPESGIVLVLIPGGGFTMGAQWSDPDEAGYDPTVPGVRKNLEALRQGAPDDDSRDMAALIGQELLKGTFFEGPPTPVDVEPFLLSKFEMTQGQWERCTGENPSLEQPDMNLFHAPTNPVNQVDWEPCELVLGRLGLVLPHERQWEYAARAGTTTPWWTGNENAAVRAAENLMGDKDGYRQIAPVGSFRANRFGLYDVLGNVSEWCGNHPYDYGDPARDNPATRLEHVARGGNNRFPALASRVSMRPTAQHLTHPSLGVRPVRIVTR